MDRTKKAFLAIFNSIEEELDVTDMGNGTGYYDALCEIDFAGSLKPRRFTDSGGRRGIVIPVESYRGFIPNQVYFERYTDSDLIIAQHHTGTSGEYVYHSLVALKYAINKNEYFNPAV